MKKKLSDMTKNNLLRGITRYNKIGDRWSRRANFWLFIAEHIKIRCLETKAFSVHDQCRLEAISFYQAAFDLACHIIDNSTPAEES